MKSIYLGIFAALAISVAAGFIMNSMGTSSSSAYSTSSTRL